MLRSFVTRLSGSCWSLTIWQRSWEVACECSSHFFFVSAADLRQAGCYTGGYKGSELKKEEVGAEEEGAGLKHRLQFTR